MFLWHCSFSGVLESKQVMFTFNTDIERTCWACRTGKPLPGRIPMKGPRTTHGTGQYPKSKILSASSWSFLSGHLHGGLHPLKAKGKLCVSQHLVKGLLPWKRGTLLLNGGFIWTWWFGLLCFVLGSCLFCLGVCLYVFEIAFD